MTIAKPLHYLLEKGVNYEWTEVQETAFNELKNHFISPLVLQYPDFDPPFYLHTNTSGIGLEAVLAQKNEHKKEYAIAYASKSLT